ncbi:MAG: FeoA family protein [Methanoregula sp.]|nr:MAG: FeoA family protein [Methanoregula sp.]
MPIPICDLQEGVTATVRELQGGLVFQRQMRTMGIREEKTIRIVTRHPFGGPVVVEIDGKMTTLGHGIASRILVEPTQ